jgi:hypothetical protein
VDEQERLIQRFLDQDLTPEERVRFLETVDSDPALRRQWLNIEMVVAEAGRLPRITPSSQFRARVLARLNAQPKGWVERARDFFVVPRTLEWNVAGAVALACMALVAMVAVARLVPGRVADMPGAAGPGQTAENTGAQEPTVFVRLVLLQPEAHSVSVAGDFNGWNPGRTSMERSDGGVWTATIPLKPGRYQYMFVIDGKRWIADPLATEDAGDGFGSHNAVLDVSI